MINIKNEEAAAEAKRLSRELIETAIAAFAGLPAGVELQRMLAGVNIDLREAKVNSGSFRWNQPQETVEISFVALETAGAEHAAAITELTRIHTSELAVEHCPDAIAQAREMLRADLMAEHERLSRPLRMGWLLRGAEKRQQMQRDALIRRAIDTLKGLPLSGAIFDEAVASILEITGSTSAEHVDSGALKQQAQARLREFETRRETVLMLAWEAIFTEDGGTDMELKPAARRNRLGRAKQKAREAEEKAAAARARAQAEKREEEAMKKRALAEKRQEEARKRAQSARERVRPRESVKVNRPRWSPSEPEPDDDYEVGG